MTTLETLVENVENGDEAQAVSTALQLISEKRPPLEIIQAMTVGVREVGERFARMEVFLPEMTLAARAMQAVLKALDPILAASGAVVEKRGVIVIGTVEGDMHTIGKDIVASLLRVQAFEVHDLGVDVNPLDFIRKAQEVSADVIGASSLMTTTMPGQKALVELLKTMNLRDRYHVILGGAPVTQEWVSACGADSWGENAWKAVEIIEHAVQERR